MVSKKNLVEFFAKDTLELIKKKHCDLIDLNNIMAKIYKYNKLKKQQNMAILDALNINPAFHTKGTRVKQ